MLIFLRICHKIGFFALKLAKRRQRPIGTQKDDGPYFFELPGYENPMVEKIIFELSPIEKKLVCPNKAFGRHFEFCAFS